MKEFMKTYTVKAGSQCGAKQCVTLRHLHVDACRKQQGDRIDSEPIFAFPYTAFLCLVIKKFPTFLITNLCVSRINAMQGVASLCEPALINRSITIIRIN